MESYSEIMRMSEDTLRQLLNLYLQIEKGIPKESRWRLEIMVPPPLGLEGIVVGKSMPITEFIRHRIEVLDRGHEGMDYWKDMLGRVNKAYSLYQGIEKSMPQEYLWNIMLKDSATASRVLPSAYLAKKIEEIERRISYLERL